MVIESSTGSCREQRSAHVMKVKMERNSKSKEQAGGMFGTTTLHLLHQGSLKGKLLPKLSDAMWKMNRVLPVIAAIKLEL